eukprot:5702294-Pleurochrysis_carterae.AAC.2
MLLFTAVSGFRVVLEPKVAVHDETRSSWTKQASTCWQTSPSGRREPPQKLKHPASRCHFSPSIIECKNREQFRPIMSVCSHSNLFLRPTLPTLASLPRHTAASSAACSMPPYSRCDAQEKPAPDMLVNFTVVLDAGAGRKALEQLFWQVKMKSPRHPEHRKQIRNLLENKGLPTGIQSENSGPRTRQPTFLHSCFRPVFWRGQHNPVRMALRVGEGSDSEFFLLFAENRRGWSREGTLRGKLQENC